MMRVLNDSFDEITWMHRWASIGPNLNGVAIQITNTEIENIKSTVLLDGIKELIKCDIIFPILPFLNIQYSSAGSAEMLSSILKNLVGTFASCMMKISANELRFHMKEAIHLSSELTNLLNRNNASRGLIKPLMQCISTAQKLNATSTSTLLTSFHVDLYNVLVHNQLYSMAHRYIEQHHTIIEVDTSIHPLEPKNYAHLMYTCGKIYTELECYHGAISYFEEVLICNLNQAYVFAAYKNLMMLYLIVHNKEYKTHELFSPKYLDRRLKKSESLFSKHKMQGYDRVLAVYLDRSKDNISRHAHDQNSNGDSALNNPISVQTSSQPLSHLKRLETLLSDRSFMATIDAENIPLVCLLTSALSRQLIKNLLSVYIAMSVEEIVVKIFGEIPSSDESLMHKYKQEVVGHISYLVKNGEVKFASIDQIRGTVSFDQDHCQAYISQLCEKEQTAMEVSGAGVGADVVAVPAINSTWSSSLADKKATSRKLIFNKLRQEMEHSNKLAIHLRMLHHGVISSEAYIYNANKGHFMAEAGGMGIAMGAMDMGETMDMRGFRPGPGIKIGSGISMF